jgi:glutaminase
VRSVIRRDYRADLVRSNRPRTPEERNILAERGGKIAVLEAQGALFFGSAEQLLRRLGQLAAEACYVIVDFKRVHLADTSARADPARGTHHGRRRNRALVRLDGRRRTARPPRP